MLYIKLLAAQLFRAHRVTLNMRSVAFLCLSGHGFSNLCWPVQSVHLVTMETGPDIDCLQ